MAASASPTKYDPKVGINPDVTLQSGDPPASFTEGDDKYTAPSGERGAKITHAWVVNVGTTAALLRVWYTESGGSRDKIASISVPPTFKPRVLDWLVGQVMEPGDLIELASDTASALRVFVSVIEMA